MTRRPDWMARLLETVEIAGSLPFAYGLHDCCTFAARCVDVMCGTDLVHQMQHRHPYAGETAASERIAAAGGLASLVSLYLGEPMPMPQFASPGDVVLATNTDGEEAIGVIVGHQIVLPSKTYGIATLPVSAMITAWRI